MNHAQKVKLALHQRSHQEFLDSVSIFTTKFWMDRKALIRANLLKKIENRRINKPIVFLG